VEGLSLNLLGYWKARLDDDYPCPQELEAELPQGFRAQVLSYLEEPPGAFELPEKQWGVSWCRYGCEQANGSGELSDGVWVWPEGLAHYVRHHNLGLLPDEFLCRVARHVADPTREIARAVDPGLIDETAWISWGRKHRRPEFAASLTALHHQATRFRADELEREGRAASERFGVTGERCWNQGCVGEALRVNPLCGRCYSEAMGGRFNMAEHEVLAAFLKGYRHDRG